MSDAVPVDDAPAGIWAQLHRLLWWLKVFLYAVCGFSLLLLVGQTVLLYQWAANIQPLFGYAVVVLIIGALGLVLWPAYQFLQIPRVVRPPAIPDRQHLRIHHLRREASYLDDYLGNCQRNPGLASKSREVQQARTELAAFAAKARSAAEGQLDELSQELSQWTERHLPAILTDIDSKADRLIYQESLAVGLATAASPNGTLDAFFMLWRSVNLISRLALLYYGRPGLWGTLAICRDVSVAAALAGYLQNVTDSLGGLIAKTVGGVGGVVAGPAIEGVTNGLVLIRIGYLARERCRAIRKWDTQNRQSAILASLSATQKVAVGLSTEILRQVGSGLGAVVGKAASGMSNAAGAVADGMSTAATSALSAALELGQSLGTIIRGKPTIEPPSE